MDLIIIGDKGGSRIKPLYSLLLNDNRFSVKICSPVFLTSFSDSKIKSSGFDVEKSTIYSLRKLSLAEIGCALAHNNAREYLSKKEFGGIILEDDARIVDIDYFYSAAKNFLELTQVAALLNMSTSLISEELDYEPIWKINMRKQKTYTSLSVGYALNKLGAESLSSTAHRFFSVADWPYAKISKYTLTYPAITHGDAFSASIIDPNGTLNRSSSTLKNRLMLFSFYYYFQNRKTFESIQEFIIVMIIPRLRFFAKKLINFDF